MPGLFITATGTDIGKTAITTLLVRQLCAAGRPVRALKPLLSGFDAGNAQRSDAGLLLAAAGLEVTTANLDAITPWRFAAPLSPDMAAAREGRAIDFDALVAFCRTALADSAQTVLIEGVGGAMVPLDARHTVLDWIAALGLPAVVVAGSYLGTISHSLTTIAAMQARGLTVAALILSESLDSPVPPAETAETLARFTDVPIHIVPRLTFGADGLPALEGVPDLTRLA